MRLTSILILVFVVVPLIELMLLIEIGRIIGPVPTIVLVVLTGMVGAALARWQGLGVLRKIRGETAAGHLPAGALVDGAIILVAAAVLMTPGVLTDLFGLFCLLPAGRRLVRTALGRKFKGAVRSGKVTVTGGGFGGTGTVLKPPMRNVTPDRPDEERR